MKRRTVLAGMTLGTLGLAACGSGSGSGSGGDAVEITYMHRLPDGDGMTKVDDIVATWNKDNPSIQVKAVKFDGKANEMIVRLENEISAGTAPDLAQLGYAEIPSLYTKGLVQDVAKEAEKYEKNFAAGAYGLMKVGEAVVGLPQDTGPLVYYYNAEEFEKLGLKVPTTADELVEVATTAAAAGKFAISFQPDEAQYWLSGQAAAAGAVWFSAEGDKWKVDVTSAETATVAEFWQKILDAKAALTEPRWGEGFTKNLVEQNLIGTIGAAWEAPLLSGDMADTPNVGQWKVVQLPTFGDKAMTGPDGGSGVAVLKGSEHQAEAMEFLNWFNTQVADLATQGLVVAATGDVTTPKDVAEFYGGQDVMSELQAANKVMNPDFIYMPTWPAVNDPMMRAADAAATGAAPVSEVFTAAQDASVSSLKDAGLPVDA